MNWFKKIFLKENLKEGEIMSPIKQAEESIPLGISVKDKFAGIDFDFIDLFYFKDGEEMREAKEQIMTYLMQQFQMMLEDNFDEYCEQFENYLRFRKNEEFHAHKHNH